MRPTAPARPRSVPAVRSASAALALCAVVVLGPSPRAQEVWRTPPADVVAFCEAPPTPELRTSPDGRFALQVERPAMPALADVVREWVGLAGLRIDVAAGARQRTAFDTGLVLLEVASGAERRVELAPGARIASLSWSPDGKRFAFTSYGDDGVTLFSADVETLRPRRVAGPLVAVFDYGFEWLPDARLLVRLVPADRGPLPERPRVPPGPIVQATDGSTGPVRTYQDLLASEHDARLLDHFATARLAIVDVAGEPSEPRPIDQVGPVGSYLSTSASPDGRWLLVSRLERPYSYLVPYYRFARAYEVWSIDGRERRVVTRRPIADDVPIEGVETGPRQLSWAQNEPATLVWAEALDGGDPEVEVPQRDRWMALEAPFTGASDAAREGGELAERGRELARIEHRARGIEWLETPGFFVTTEYDRDRRWTRALLHGAGDEPLAIEDRSARDRYGDPGDLATRRTPEGARVVRVEDGALWRVGRGATPEGDRPFLARQDLATRAVDVVWRSEPGTYETVVDVVALAPAPRFVTRRESPADPPNYRLRDLGAETDVALTAFPDPTPALRGIEKRLLSYERADGVPLSATLYLPADRVEGERLPLFVWAYPIEFNDAGTAGQVSGSADRFTRVSGTSPLLFATRGWAVLDGATMPVIGDPETVNDTFVEQIVMAAEAAIDCAVDLGVADRARVAIGGHSYGAFMTVNLLAHSDLFRAGVARSGAYNRTLTPFGFQSERRTLWEAPEAYVAVSPFLHADRVNEPLLLVHGERDDNPGTFPLQSDRLYHAIAGNGGTVRYLKLPGEAHGYRARESVLHLAAETLDWLDRHVKAAPLEAASDRHEPASEDVEGTR